jgi:hypothetical protein
VLVATFDDAQALGVAATELNAASFGGDDVVCLKGERRHAVAGLWAKVCALRFQSADKRFEANAAQMAEEIMDGVLMSGGGIVLVRCPTRFHQACDIIERTGGHIGLLPRDA